MAGAVVLVAGCATLADTPASPPAGVFHADVGFPPIGTRWVLNESSHDEKTGRTRSDTRTRTVTGEGVHGGRPVYHVWDGAFVHVHDRATGNWMAVLDKNSTVMYADDPHEGSLAFPLWVGRRWTARYTGHEPVRGRSFHDMTFVWQVVAYEDVQVPAGTFKAFRVEIVEADERARYPRRTYWYAPELKVIVKKVDRPGADWDEERVRRTTELVRYTAAEPGPVRSASGMPRSILERPTVVPLEVVGNLTLVGVTINRAQRAMLLVDTGASGSTITPAVASRLGVTVTADTPRRRVTVADGRDVRVPFVKITSFQVGAATVEDLEVGVLDSSPDAAVIGGLLGGDFLGRFTITLDHARRELRLEPRSAGDPK